MGFAILFFCALSIALMLIPRKKVRHLEVIGVNQKNRIIYGETRLNVVGESHYKENLIKIKNCLIHHYNNKKSVVAELIAEKNNKYDQNAIAVHIAGLKVGYLSKADASLNRSALNTWREKEKKFLCKAFIAGGEGEKTMIGVILFLPETIPNVNQSYITTIIEPASDEDYENYEEI